MYQKEIIYIGLYKDGSRIGNAGFLKVENREQESRLDLKLRNIPFNIKGRFPIRIHNGNDWKEINGVSVQEGGGSWEENVEDAAQKVQIQVMLPGGISWKAEAGMRQQFPRRSRQTQRVTIHWIRQKKRQGRKLPEAVPKVILRLNYPDCRKRYMTMCGILYQRI